MFFNLSNPQKVLVKINVFKMYLTNVCLELCPTLCLKIKVIILYLPKSQKTHFNFKSI